MSLASSGCSQGVVDSEVSSSELFSGYTVAVQGLAMTKCFDMFTVMPRRMVTSLGFTNSLAGARDLDSMWTPSSSPRLPNCTLAGCAWRRSSLLR